MCAQWKLVAPRPWGPGFQPGMWAALWATPLPATESEEGTQAGHQLCRFYQLLTGEGRAREKEKQTQTSSHRPAQMQIFLGAGGERAQAPIHASSWPPREAQQRGPQGGELHVSQNATGHKDPGLFPASVGSSDPPLSKAWIPSVLSPSWCPHHSLPLPESGLPKTASWRADGWKCLLSAMLGLSVHL